MPTTTPITDTDLRWSYRRSRLAQQGITYQQAIETPCLRSTLELGAVMRRRKHCARLASSSAGAGIERSHPEFSSTHQP